MGPDISAECKYCSQVRLEYLSPVIIGELMSWVSPLDAATIE